MEASFLFIFTAFAFGACVGSFLNVVIYRVPRGLSVADPKRSFCPSCRTQIPWQRNIPLLSWLELGGKCATCTAAIPARYFAVELATALLFTLAAFQRFEPGTAVTGAALAGFAVDATLAALVVAIAVIDFQHAIIPDPLTVPWIPLLVTAVALEPSLLRGKLLDASASGLERLPLAGALAGLALGVLPALFADFLSRRREAVEPGAAVPSALPEPDEVFSIGAETRAFFLPVIAPGLAGALAGGLLGAARAEPLAPAAAAAVAALAGAGAGLAFVFVLRFVFSLVFRREAMGLGDAKFLGLFGTVLGAEGTLLTFLAGSLLGALPALGALFLTMPIAIAILVGSVALPIAAILPLGRALGPGLALLLLAPVPLVALVWFLRRLRSASHTMMAMPFGPFLAAGALALLLFWDPLLAACRRLLPG